MVKGFPWEALVVIGDEIGCGVGGVGVELKELHAKFLICRYSVLKTRSLRMNPTRTAIAHIAHPTTCDVSTHGTWILGSRDRFWCTSPENRRCCLDLEQSDGQCGIVQ